MHKKLCLIHFVRSELSTRAIKTCHIIILSGLSELEVGTYAHLYQTSSKHVILAENILQNFGVFMLKRGSFDQEVSDLEYICF